MFELTLHLNHQTQSIPVEAGQSISEILQQHVPSFALPCAGNHTCGKCRVQASGALSPLSDAEKKFLTDTDIQAGIRLACDCTILGNAAVTVQTEQKARIIAWYQTPPFEKTETGYGFAVDIGTTTVAVQLIQRETGRILAERLAENAQRSYGADVISRIEACKTAGLDTLSDRIAQQIEQLAQECLQEAGICAVSESIVTGNATMLHIYEGLDPASLAVSPFDVQSYFGCFSRRTLAGAPVYLPRCIGAYVGADIICAILAADLEHGGTQLLADIGTNGEMALFHADKLLCCATAAGPAFEGAGISAGMPAASGAIRAVSLQDDSVHYETVQDAPAIGICGSGIIDAVGELIKTGVVDKSGRLLGSDRLAKKGVSAKILEHIEESRDANGNDFVLFKGETPEESVYITQKDIREVQLAKAAISAGISIMMEEIGLTKEEIEKISIAGAFGNYIRNESAVNMGLLPRIELERIKAIGNSAGVGAAMVLLSKGSEEEAVRVSQIVEHIDLAEKKNFQDEYLKGMRF